MHFKCTACSQENAITNIIGIAFQRKQKVLKKFRTHIHTTRCKNIYKFNVGF